MAEYLEVDGLVAAQSEAAGCFWLGFTLDHGAEEARADFRRRFGVEPERVLVGRSVLLVGPVVRTGELGG